MKLPFVLRCAASRLAAVVAFACAAACSTPAAEGPGGGSGGALAPGEAGSGGTSASTGSGGSPSGTGGGPVEQQGARVGAAVFEPGELDAPSRGATITFENIGAPGWYPSRRDPSGGGCDAYQEGQCCMARHEIESEALSPWDEDLVVTLRGPMHVKQFIVYQPENGTADWSLVSLWDERTTIGSQGITFDGNGAESSGWGGEIGSECLVDVMPDEQFPCGPGSVPYCPAGSPKYYGWSGSKLLVILASMPHASASRYSPSAHCGTGTAGNWYDAPWIGLSHGELVRSGKFGDCHCYAKNPAEWWLADGCGQFNAFEVVNDNNAYRNLELFSTNLFAYHGYVGEGPCGSQCDLSTLPGDVDLVNKSTSGPATSGALATPAGGPGAAFRRPSAGFRYFLILLDTNHRTIQLGLVHPQSIPAALNPILPELPHRIDAQAVDALRSLRLPM